MRPLPHTALRAAVPATVLTLVLGVAGLVTGPSAAVAGTGGSSDTRGAKAAPAKTAAPAAAAKTQAPAAPAKGLAIGDTVPDFRLPDARTGDPVSLYAYAGDETVAIIVVATRCPYSNAYNALMAGLPERYQGKKVRFLGINPNRTEPAADVVAHAEAHGLTFPIVKDAGQKIVDRLGAKVTPEVFVVAPDRTLVYHGSLGNSADPTADPKVATTAELDEALGAHLAGKKVPAPERKAFGCSIKR